MQLAFSARLIQAAALCTLLASAAVGDDPPAVATPATPTPKLGTVEKGSLTIIADRPGRIGSAKKTIVRFEPEAFSGSVTVEQIVAVPGPVKAGAIIAQLKGKDFSKALGDMRIQVAESVERLAMQQEEQTVARAADAIALERAQRAALLSDQHLKLAREYYFARDLESQSLRQKAALDNLKDQGDELSQLERMYSDATLESETKDIVIGRARRGMERSLAFQKFSEKDYDIFLSVGHPNEIKETEDNARYSQASLDQLRIRQQLGAIGQRLAMAAATRGLDDAKLRLSRMESDGANMTVKAPVDGLMSLSVPEPGEGVAPRAVLATIVDPTALEIKGTLDVASMRVLEPGAQVSVWIPSSPEAVGTAVIDEISPIGAADGEGASFPFVASVRTKDGVWPLGAEARLVARKVIPDCILIDSAAIKSDHGSWTVEVWVDGKKEKRTIRIGATDLTKTQVLSGLSVGEQVVLPGA